MKARRVGTNPTLQLWKGEKIGKDRRKDWKPY